MEKDLILKDTPKTGNEKNSMPILFTNPNSLVELWKPTNYLQNLLIEEQAYDGVYRTTTLQQLWVSNLHNEEWRDIPTKII